MTDPWHGECEKHGRYKLTEWRGKYVDEGCFECRREAMSKLLPLSERDEDTISEWFTGAGPKGASVPPSWKIEGCADCLPNSSGPPICTMNCSGRHPSQPLMVQP